MATVKLGEVEWETRQPGKKTGWQESGIRNEREMEERSRGENGNGKEIKKNEKKWK